jgi:hypothetical protein
MAESISFPYTSTLGEILKLGPLNLISSHLSESNGLKNPAPK